MAEPSTSTSAAITRGATTHTHTYHCLCTQLILITSTPLPSLPRRSNALDRASILPLRLPLRLPHPHPAPPPSPNSSSSSSTHPHSLHYATLISTNLSTSKPQIITNDQGFEKRYMQRCGRCGVVVGYMLDWHSFPGDGDNKSTGRSRIREDVVYLLPGGLMTTEEMAMGRSVDERIIGFEGIVV